MTAQLTIDFDKPETQWQRVLNMLKNSPNGVTTAQFCSTMGLAAEYRRAITECRRKGYNIPKPERVTDSCFRYKLVEEV